MAEIAAHALRGHVRTSARALTLGAALVLLGAGLWGCAGQARQDLEAARSQAAAGNLEAAYAAYQAILQTAPDNVEAASGLAQTRTLIVTRAAAQADAAAAESGPEMVQLQQALTLLDAAKPFDPGGAEIAPHRSRFEQRITALEAELAALAGRVSAQAAAGNIESARGELAAIRAKDPNYAELGSLEREIDFAAADIEIANIERALGARDLDAGRAALARLKAIDADPARIAQVEAEFNEHELAILREDITGFLETQRYYRAWVALRASGREPELPTLTETLRAEGSQFYRVQAERRLALGQPERGYLEAVKGLELDRTSPGLFELHRDARDQVQAGLQIYIAVPTFGAPVNQPDLGSQFTDALISHLFRVLPYGIHIAEREKIDLVMREQGFAEAGNVLNVQLIVSGNVSLLKIERRDNEQQAVARVQVGEKVEANPAYETAVRAREREAAAAAASGKTVEPTSGMPEPTITAPVYELIRYRRGTAEVKGFATVAARIFDTRKGSIAYAQEFNAKYEVADDFQDSVDGAQIEGDPLELPADTEVSEALRNKLVGQLSELITSQFENREKSYLDEARYYLTRREREQAMKPLAQGFLYGVQASLTPDDPDYAALLDLIVDETERDFLTDLASAPASAGPGDTR